MTNIDEALDVILDEIFDDEYTVGDFLSEILTELEEKPADENYTPEDFLADISKAIS